MFVKSILNKFITQVAPPSNNIKNSGFHLEDQDQFCVVKAKFHGSSFLVTSS